MRRLDIDGVGISDSRLKGIEIQTSVETLTHYSGNNDKEYRNAAAIMIKKYLKCFVLNFHPISDRVLLLQLRAKPVDINIVQVYCYLHCCQKSR